MPPAARHLDALRERGGRVVVIDPRRTPTADRADVVVQPVPGTDLALALGVLHLLVANGDVDEEYVAARTSGFDEVRRSVAAWWPERVERVTGVPVAELRELATLLGKAPKVMVLTARGAEQHSQGTDTVLAWINVALALGQCGRERAGYGCLTGQGNGQGGREHGQKADQLPGYRMIDDPAAREHVAGVWGVPPESLPGKGRSAYELLEALGTDDRVPRRCSSSAATSSSRPRTPRTSPSASPRSTCWSSPTSSCPRPRRWPTSSCPSPSSPRRPAR